MLGICSSRISCVFFFVCLFVLSNSPFDTCCFLFIALCGVIARRCVVVQKLRYISSIPRSIYIVYTQYRLWTEIISALYRIHNCHMNCLWLFWSIENFMFYYCICRHRQLTTLIHTHTHICYSMCSNNITFFTIQEIFSFQIPMIWMSTVVITHTPKAQADNDDSGFVEIVCISFSHLGINQICLLVAFTSTLLNAPTQTHTHTPHHFSTSHHTFYTFQHLSFV